MKSMVTDKTMRTTGKNSGFSLIELLIVVAIILVIAAIAIPNFLRAKISANEASAIGSMKTLATAEVGYSTTFAQVGYAPTIVELGPGAGNQSCPAAGPSAANACLIDAVLSGATSGNPAKSGYGFAAFGQNAAGGQFMSFTAAAVPLSYNITGVRDFCAFDDQVQRQHPPSPANTGGAPAAAVLATGGGPIVCTVAPWLPIPE
jgi:type IV pilus assembly protein PilA